VGIFFLALLYTDTIIWRILGHHLDGAVLNVALTPGSEDAVHLGLPVWGSVALIFVVGSGILYWSWSWFLADLIRRQGLGLGTRLLLQPRVVLLLVLLPVVGLEKSVYAAADMSGDWELKMAARPLPLYPRANISRYLDGGSGAPLLLQVMPESAELDYPHTRPVLPADGPRPNILIVVLDSWRRDMFNPQLTPGLHAFSQDARVFNNHISGGNGTRFGLFSMLYGLHGSYWFKALAERASPVLMDTLEEAGYERRVFSAASMNFPEFRPTAWSGLADEEVVDRFEDESGEELSRISYKKDRFVAQAFGDWVEQRSNEVPFFCFILLDAPHQPYYNPGGPHQPTVDKLNYVQLGITTSGPELAELREKVKNTYMNSVLHADRTATRILAALERAGLSQETLVVVTGDHGEEFCENGFWGHTSNFSPEQMEVPFYMRGPGIEAGQEDRPTSHVDVSNSLLECLGADPALSVGYSLGLSLFDPPAERARVMGAWGDLGVWTDSGIFQIPLDSTAKDIEVYDRAWNLLPDGAQRCEDQREVLGQVARECVLFLRQRK
jgi:membrane-anchored protein YejM (alkaline phosphatase superfamily)